MDSQALRGPAALRENRSRSRIWRARFLLSSVDAAANAACMSPRTALATTGSAARRVAAPVNGAAGAQHEDEDAPVDVQEEDAAAPDAEDELHAAIAPPGTPLAARAVAPVVVEEEGHVEAEPDARAAANSDSSSRELTRVATCATEPAPCLRKSFCTRAGGRPSGRPAMRPAAQDRRRG